jgi:SAM-dependent methyltransferase
MNDLRKQTIQTFNKSAEQLTKYFQDTGPRVGDIELALALAGDPENPQVLEIGFGSGRDAEEILRRAGYYKGIDVSEAFVEHARQQLPEGQFELADAATYDYVGKYDVVYAFASLMYMSKDEVRRVLDKVHEALRPGGIFYISLRYGEKYKETIRNDRFGTRLHYLYNPQLIRELAGDNYAEVYGTSNSIANTPWFEIALKKVANATN